MVFGHGGNTVTRMPKAAEGLEKLELMVVADPHPTTWAVLSERKNDTYLLADLHAVRVLRLAHGVEPLAAVVRTGRRPDLRVEDRLRGVLSAGQEARARRLDVQEHQGREQCAVGRGSAARNQSRRLLDRLLRPVAGAPQGAHEEPGQVRPGHAACGQGRAGGRRRLLRPAVAVLGQAGNPASRHAPALQHPSACEGWRRHVPRPLRHRVPGRQTCSPKARTRWARS